VCIGAEPVPYIPRDAVKQALLDGPKLTRDLCLNTETTRSSTLPPLELMTMPVCLQFARALGGRSFVGRRMMLADKQSNQEPRAAATTASRRTRSVSEATPSVTAAASNIHYSLSDVDDIF